MFSRTIAPHLKALFSQYPFVTLTGARQSGKTTLCKAVFPELKYANLEAPDQREFALSDPRGFLSGLSGGAILDEVQRVPELLSYLQVLADEDGGNGLFVLAGSEQFQLSDAIAQTLAGRTALLKLLPLSITELQGTGISDDIDNMLYSGFYPRLHDQRLEPRQALGYFLETYIERDVCRVGNIRNLIGFQRFMRLCADSVGQLVHLSTLGADAGVSHTTAREWLSILEASYVVFMLRPYHGNLNKRLIKSPKLYFYDVGIASYLLGLEHAGQVATHPLRGALFENAMVLEALKHRLNHGLTSNLSFFRDARGLECDLLYKSGEALSAIECKSGATVASDYFANLNRVEELLPSVKNKIVIYGGTEKQSRNTGTALPLAQLDAMLTRIDSEN